MRCPDCNKFVSYDDPTCDVNHVEVNGAAVSASVQVQLCCCECGTTLKEAEVTAEADIEHTCGGGEGDEFEIEEEGYPEGSSRVQTTDRNGKPIKSSRYMKTFYGFTLDTKVRCLKCQEVINVTLEGDEQASAFD